MKILECVQRITVLVWSFLKKILNFSHTHIPFRISHLFLIIICYFLRPLIVFILGDSIDIFNDFFPIFHFNFTNFDFYQRILEYWILLNLNFSLGICFLQFPLLFLGFIMIICLVFWKKCIEIDQGIIEIIMCILEIRLLYGHF